MKYIITDSEFEPKIVIGEEVGHEDLKLSVGKAKIVGAGHFIVNDGKVQVFGKSIGLGITPGNLDANYIATFLGLGWDNVLPNKI